MPDNGRKTLKLVDCVDTVEEEHVEGMKEERGHDHDEDDAEHEEHEVEHEEDEADHEEHGQEETHSVHEIDEHVWTSPLNAVKIVEQIKKNSARLIRKMHLIMKKCRSLCSTIERIGSGISGCGGSFKTKADDFRRQISVPLFCRSIWSGLLCSIFRMCFGHRAKRSYNGVFNQ